MLCLFYSEDSKQYHTSQNHFCSAFLILWFSSSKSEVINPNLNPYVNCSKVFLSLSILFTFVEIPIIYLTSFSSLFASFYFLIKFILLYLVGLSNCNAVSHSRFLTFDASENSSVRKFTLFILSLSDIFVFNVTT